MFEVDFKVKGVLMEKLQGPRSAVSLHLKGHNCVALPNEPTSMT
jgi:hypothetical protein